VRGSKPVGVELGKEARVSPTVVADGDGSPAKVNDLDQVRMARLFTWVVVVTSMDRVDSAGGHRIIQLCVCRVKHRPSPSGGRVSASIEPLPDALENRMMGRSSPTNGGASIR